jgi:hypothetical protein
MAGKGDSYRPVNQKVYGENYDAIFRKGNHEPTADQAPSQAAAVCPVCRCSGPLQTCPCGFTTDRQAAGPRDD